MIFFSLLTEYAVNTAYFVGNFQSSSIFRLWTMESNNDRTTVIFQDCSSVCYVSAHCSDLVHDHDLHPPCHRYFVPLRRCKNKSFFYKSTVRGDRCDKSEHYDSSFSHFELAKDLQKNAVTMNHFQIS
jgi:hypothetical protein